MNLTLTVNTWHEGSQYVAQALPLDVLSSGETPHAAREALDEAVRCFIRTAQEEGTLDQILEECGYSRTNGEWVAPDWVGVERRAVTV